MKRIIPVVAAAALGVVTVAAQDSTEKTKTKVSVDDGRAITLTGCLEQQAGPLFVLRGSSSISSDEVTARTRVKTDVDDDGTEVKRSAKSEVDHDDDVAVGTSGLVGTYELTAKQGLDLAPHVGKQVQVTAIALDPKDGDDDAKVKVRETTRVDREDAPDSKVKTKTTAELPRGSHTRVTVVSVKPLGTSCDAK
jgi:hypothetical protein